MHLTKPSFYNPVMETSRTSPSKTYVANVDLFDQILRAVAEFQASLTIPMQYLVKDASGASGVQVCILSRTRITFTTAVKSLMDSYEHWANIGTSLEDPYCRGHAVRSIFICKNFTRSLCVPQYPLIIQYC
jgi:hypothetical protein